MKILFFLCLIWQALLSSLAFAHALKQSSSELVLENGVAHWQLNTHADDYQQKFGNTDLSIVSQYLSTRLGIDVGGKTCSSTQTKLEPYPQEQRVQINLEFSCPKESGPVTLNYNLFYGDLNHRHLLNFHHEGQAQSYTFSPENTEVTFEKKSFWKQILNFSGLGFEHILTGYDHILFIFSLILGATCFRKLFWMATTFTLAHSASLALAVLDIVQLSPKIVEPAIAASIVFLACKSLFYPKLPIPLRERETSTGGQMKGSLATTFLFGLIHGLGFSGALREANLSGTNMALPLLSFNFGVELGQALIISAVYPLIKLLEKHLKNNYRKLKVVTLACIALAGLFWFVTRVWS